MLYFSVLIFLFFFHIIFIYLFYIAYLTNVVLFCSTAFGKSPAYYTFRTFSKHRPRTCFTCIIKSSNQPHINWVPFIHQPTYRPTTIPLLFQDPLASLVMQHTSFDTRAMPRVIFFCIKNIKKKLKIKNLGFFCKVILKNLGFGCNTWPKSNIYNINNKIKLAWPKFKWVWL
jgi:hypothetical protein